jgi:hypothetical protein
MTKCPRCFHTLSTDQFAWLCVNGDCAREPDRTATSYQGAPVSSRAIVYVTRPNDSGRRWTAPEKAFCPECGSQSREVCPDCHYLLPPRWRGGQATCIAMAGARATGKSIYIGVMLQQFELLATMMGTTMTAANDATANNLRDNYLNPLYVQRGALRPTPSAGTENVHTKDPLIFSIGNVDNIHRYLVIRDVAGEDLESGRFDIDHLAFFRFADAVLFMFDPLRIEVIHDLLRNKLPRQLESGGDPVAVLTTIRQIIGTSSPRLGVVLSKFDAMEALAEVDDPAWQRVMSNPGAAIRRDPSLSTTGYNRRDGELLHHEVRSLMFKLKAERLVLLLENPNDGNRLPFRFFAVSALGESTDGHSLNGRGIASFRCLDPIKWVLGDMGVLQISD